MATSVSDRKPASDTARPAEVDARTAREWVESGKGVIIDVREPDEHAAEWVAGARSMPLSGFDAGALRLIAAERVVLHCRGGTRSGEALRLALAQGVNRPALFSMAGGIEAWKKAGLPVERGAWRAPISVMRQTQIVIGAGVLAGAIGAYFVDPLFNILPAFFGAGLVFAGLSGTCGLAWALSRMPWNKVECASGGCVPSGAGER